MLEKKISVQLIPKVKVFQVKILLVGIKKMLYNYFFAHPSLIESKTTNLTLYVK